MSLVNVSNRKDQIEMNDLEFLVWDDGWNGGTWNNWDVVSNPNNFDFTSFQMTTQLMLKLLLRMNMVLTVIWDTDTIGLLAEFM